MPPRERWREQLRQRPLVGSDRIQYDDYEYAEEWYGRYERWLVDRRPITRLSLAYRPELVGLLPDEDRTTR